jgi:hypothetical protein
LRRITRAAVTTIDSLEPRQLLSSASLTLHTAYIRLDPDDADIVQVYESATPTGTPEHTYTRSDLTSLVIRGTTGDDTLTIDYSHGTPLKDGVLAYNAGDGEDTLTLVGRSAIRATIAPTTANSGDIKGYLQHFAYAGVESIEASDFSAVTLTTPSAADDITLDRTSAGVAEISSSGSSPTFPAISIDAGIPKIVLDLATNDASSATVSLTCSRPTP